MNNSSVTLVTCLSGVTRVCSPKGNIYSVFFKYGDGQSDTVNWTTNAWTPTHGELEQRQTMCSLSSHDKF